MEKIYRNKIIFLITGVISLSFLSSCRSPYLCMSTDYSYKYAWKKDNSAFAFTAINRLYRMPEGIAKFPDGGKSKTVYFDAALYYFDIRNEKLNRIADFKDFFILYPKKQDYQNLKLAFDDFRIYYKFPDANDFDIQSAKKYVHGKDDSVKLAEAVKNTSKIFVYQANTKETIKINALPENVSWADKNNIVYLKDLRKNCLKNITCADWGIVLKSVYPQSDKKYKNYIIYKKGNELSRNAVLKQVVSHFDENQISKMMDRMTKYKAKLNKKALKSVSYKNKLNADSYNSYYIKTVEELKNIIKKED